MNKANAFHIGIDLGGTKIEIIALDASGEQIYRRRVDTPKGDYPATVDAIVSLINQCEEALNGRGTIGVGIPGAVSRKTGLIKNANSTWLIGEDLQGDLTTALQRSVALQNDANCFVLSEAVDGSAAGAQCVFGVIIGTGCGGGIVFGGQVISGVNAIGGEWGHNPLPWSCEETQLDCYCGLIGCNETFLSGSGLERHYQQRSGKNLTAKQIEAAALQGDETAEKLLDDYVIWLAKGLAAVINVVDPDVIVLGGGMSNFSRLYAEVPTIWHQWVFSDQVDTRLVAPKFGDSSGVRGAAWLGKSAL
ncbi:ROK family protein [Thiomicrorhabdus sp.]|uniref:ROK family protein n=1 Tax=Thiomicrorhabdus sp. TaxID=2039724 RepID=UPI0029C69FFF|nr:ROK family protein [Thiomicrorhabdus sp.]